MMRDMTRRSWVGVGLLAWLLLAWPAGWAPAQTDEAPADAELPAPVEDAAPADAPAPADSDSILQREVRKSPPPPTQIDLEGLLKDDAVFATTAEDPIWKITPRPGTMLVQVPIIIEPGDQPFEFDQDVFAIRGGRFLAWRLVDDMEKAPDSEFASGRKRKSVALEEIEAALPDDVPRITRRFTVQPNGKINWKMDRVIQGGQVIVSEKLYALRLESELLAKQNPVPPDRKATAGDRAALRAADAKYRADKARYNDLAKQVRSLPTEFADDLPYRVWAIFEVRELNDKLQIEGPTPLPWTIGIEQLRAMREAVKQQLQPLAGPDGEKYLPESAYDQIAHMHDLCLTRHPYSYRMVAWVLTFTGMTPYAEPDDALFDVLSLSLKGTDATARRVVMKELVSVIPPTRASTTLLTQAAPDMDKATQLDWLKGRMNVAGASQQQAQETLVMLNNQLADPAGPPPREILGELIAANDGSTPAPGGGQPNTGALTDNSSLLVSGIRFEKMPEDRLNEALTAVVELAATEPLARRWLDQRLLASQDKNLVRRTLTVLRSADSGQPVLKPVVSGAMSLVFGSRKEDPDAAEPPAEDVSLAGAIPLDSPNHGLFRCMQSGDAQISQMAFESLPNFTLDAPGLPQAANGDERYAELVDAALSRRPTPSAIVPFLIRQPDQASVTQGLIRLTILGNGPAATQAAKALFGSGRPLDTAVHAMSFGDRHGFASRIYESQWGQGKTPLVAGLMRQPVDHATIASWFAKEVTDGRLPPSDAWAPAFGTTDQLLELVTASDEDLALGAAAALTASAGGTEAYARTLIAKMRNHSDTSIENMRILWGEARREILGIRLSAATEGYRLEVRVFAQGAGPTAMTPVPPTPAPAGNPAVKPPAKPQVITLSDAVMLKADGQTIGFANQTVALTVPDTLVAIRIQNPAELNNFSNNSDVIKLGLERVQGPLDLLPREHGEWSCTFPLPDGRTAELHMSPVKGT